MNFSGVVETSCCFSVDITEPNLWRAKDWLIITTIYKVPVRSGSIPGGFFLCVVPLFLSSRGRGGPGDRWGQPQLWAITINWVLKAPEPVSQRLNVSSHTRLPVSPSARPISLLDLRDIPLEASLCEADLTPLPLRIETFQPPPGAFSVIFFCPINGLFFVKTVCVFASESSHDYKPWQFLFLCF